jgi:TusA-related sulfurtransferase
MEIKGRVKIYYCEERRSMEVKPDKVIDARGSFCPGPLIKLIKAVKESEVGQIISVYSTDSGSKKDIPLWVEKSGHELIGVFDRGDYIEFIVRKLK